MIQIMIEGFPIFIVVTVILLVPVFLLYVSMNKEYPLLMRLMAGFTLVFGVSYLISKF